MRKDEPFTYREVVEHPHIEGDGDYHASTARNIQERRLHNIEPKVLDDQRVLNASSTHKVGQNSKEHEDIPLWVRESFDESVVKYSSENSIKG
jgi:hypothetical protein